MLLIAISFTWALTIGNSEGVNPLAYRKDGKRVRSEWRQWTNEFRRTWRAGSAEATVICPTLDDVVEHEDGTWSPKVFTYVEHPDDPDAPVTVVELEHDGDDLLPRVVAVHVLRRSDGREVRAADLRLGLEDAVEEAWVRVSRRPTRVRDRAFQCDACPSDCCARRRRERRDGCACPGRIRPLRPVL